jgi:HAD superfamily hydrolase (TIGR01509 family)
MNLKALIFDVDGTLVNSERDGHLPACNEAFATLGIPIQWTWEEFKGMLKIAGNKLRMRKSLLELTAGEASVNRLGSSSLDEVVAQLGTLKRQLYMEKYLPQLPLRSGVVALIDEAIARGIKLAIVSTSDEAPIHALLRLRLPEVAKYFSPILGKESGVKTAPDSPLYRRCLVELGTRANETLVIEDSEVGCQAASVAGLPCAVFYNDYTQGKDFSGAALVARSAEFFDLELLAKLCLYHALRVPS